MHCRPDFTHRVHGRDWLHLLPYALHDTQGDQHRDLMAVRFACWIWIDVMSVIPEFGGGDDDQVK